jgi:hypothetical protein
MLHRIIVVGVFGQPNVLLEDVLLVERGDVGSAIRTNELGSCLFDGFRLFVSDDPFDDNPVFVPVVFKGDLLSTFGLLKVLLVLPLFNL